MSDILIELNFVTSDKCQYLNSSAFHLISIVIQGMGIAYHYSIRLLLHLLGKMNEGLKLDFFVSRIICKLCIQTCFFVVRFNYFLQESMTRVANCGFPIIVCFSSFFIGKDLLTCHALYNVELNPRPSIDLASLLLKNRIPM